uniref:Uncharacterized protein n=1 Tax=Timema monikensis TaxID=170555 RepID=A0A7R9HNZ5_9NEOP|nr:unnamed protein product [Timema monikensis]
MPRIDPLQLLKCLSVLLSPEGGIKSKDEVQRLARRAKAPQALIESYKNNEDDTLAIAFDLQQALTTPKLTSGIQFYKRKLWT